MALDIFPAIANLIGDQVKGHTRVFAILNSDVQVRPATLMVSKVTVKSTRYTNILMGTVQAGIAHGVLVGLLIELGHHARAGREVDAEVQALAADRECARVRGMHRRVVGTYATEQGERPYAASNPDLLRWVHIAFTDSFLATHRVWGGEIPGGEDAYVREWAKAGELVGVTNPPRSVAELEQQIADYGPELRGGEAARQTVDFIRNAPIPMAGKPAYAVLYAGAVSTMGPEHRRLLELPTLPRTFTKPAVGAILGGLSLALGAFMQTTDDRGVFDNENGPNGIGSSVGYTIPRIPCGLSRRRSAAGRRR